MTSPLISVFINTCNHERFIEPCVRSALGQDFPESEMEVLVVDDGSTDRTPELLRQFESRVRVIRKKNGGQVSAFNAGVAEARGEIIAFLDGDDWWAANKLSAVVRAFEENPQIAAVGHGFFEADERGEIRATWKPASRCILTFDEPEEVFRSKGSRTFLGTSRLSMRASAVARAMPVPAELPFFDNFIFAQAIAMGGALLLDDPLCYYRIHSGNLFMANQSAERQRRIRYKVVCGLLEDLPGRLKSLHVSEEAISAFLAPERAEAARLKLILDGGWPWETLSAESMNFRLEYRNPDWGYRVFKAWVLLSTLLMPPKRFYRMREWYAKKNLRRVREKIGSAALRAADVSVVRNPVQNSAER